MVFQELLSFWRDQSSLKHVFSSFDDMLATAKHMFELSSEAVFSKKKDIEQIKRSLLKMDSRLNTLQQVIRRDIITHIAVQGTADIVPCLVMMSITKDAERIGDYAKNICEVAEHQPKLSEDPLFEYIKDMGTRINDWFDGTRDAFDNTDKALARQVRQSAYSYEKNCDQLIWGLAEDNEGRNAVGIALMLRFFKRVAAHLGNILTTVIMPFDKIDYHEKED